MSTRFSWVYVGLAGVIVALIFATTAIWSAPASLPAPKTVANDPLASALPGIHILKSKQQDCKIAYALVEQGGAQHVYTLADCDGKGYKIVNFQ